MSLPSDGGQWVSRRTLVWAVCILGLGLSVTLLVDYRQSVSSLCVSGGGCDVVRHSRFAYFQGLPTPALGALYFALMLGLSLFDGLTVRRLLLVLSIAGALPALLLLAEQGLVLHAFCPYCVAVDLAALALPFLTFPSRSPPVKTGVWTRLGFGFVGLALLAVPFVIPANREAPPPVDWAKKPGGVPAFVAMEHRPGIVTIVNFIDFECPYCRKFDEILQKTQLRYGARLRVVRKHRPLSFHKHALSAAIAGICAEELNVGDAAAVALFAAPPENLTEEGAAKIVVGLGVDEASYQACIHSERPKIRLADDERDGKSVPLEGIPSMFVGSTYVVGGLSASELKVMIEQELRKPE